MENDYILLKRVRDILFFVFLTCLMLFLSLFVYIDCFAISVGGSPTSIYAHLTGGGEERYNITSNGIFYEPKDAGNELVYFNQFSKSYIGCPSVSHYYDIGVGNGVDFQYDAPSSAKTITYSIYVYGYTYNRLVCSTKSLQTNSDFVPTYLDWSFYNNPFYVDYNTSSGLKSSIPIYQGSSYVGNGGFRYTFKVNVNAGNGSIYFKSKPFSGSMHINNDEDYAIMFTTGMSIDNIENWDGSIDTGAIVDSLDTLGRDWINNSNNNTQSIITNNNNNSRSIISAITNLPSTIINGISSLFTTLWTNISGAFTTLFGWLSDIFNSIQDILSDETPTNEWLTNYINNFPGINDNLIAQIITLPIHILTKLLGVNTCSPVILGNLYGTILTLPCLGSTLSNILGSLINIVGWMVAFYIYYLTFVKIKDLLFEMLTLEGNVARKMKIKF